MPIFLTYARKDRDQAEALRRDLERARYEVWMDDELSGGQAWWDTILSQIRGCDLYVFALSPESIASRACLLELEYAQALNRPLLPIQVKDVHITLAPQAVANTHFIDYRTRSAESVMDLVTAVRDKPEPGPLPDPLPIPPAPPMSYMNEFNVLVDAASLTYREQVHLLADLKGYLDSEDDRGVTLDLIERLRARRDIAEGIGRDIDRLLIDSGRQPGSRPAPPVQPQPNQPGPVHQPSGPTYQPSGPTHQPSGPTHQPTPAPMPPPYNRPPQNQQSYPLPGPVHQPIPAQRQPAPPLQQFPPPTGQALSRHPQTMTVFVLGILALCLGCVGVILGPIGWVMGNRALAEIDRRPGDYEGRSTVRTGMTLSIVGTVVWGLVSVIYLIYLISLAAEGAI